MTDPDGVISYPGRTSEMAEKPGDAACGCLVTSQTRNSVRRSSGATETLGGLDILVNNVAYQNPTEEDADRLLREQGAVPRQLCRAGSRLDTSYSRDHGC